MRAVAAVAALWLAGAAPASAQETETRIEFQSIVVRPGQTLWDIANTYLKDSKKWDEILKYNKMPSDPTVALPGMTIRVPIKLIKENLRAARLVLKIRQVLFRRKETADWKPAKDDMELFRNDTIRTLEESKAKVKFLQEGMLVLDSNSMAEIKPVGKDYDVELKGGGAFTGNSRVATASARITPRTKDTLFSTQVGNDFSTRVKVYVGNAEVEAEGKKVDIKAGKGVEIKLGKAPGVPVDIPNLPDFPGRSLDFEDALNDLRGSKAAIAVPVKTASKIQGAGLGSLRKDLDSVSLGEPVSGYHIQAAADRSFSRMVFDKVFETDSKMDFRGLSPGKYWVKVAKIDLLGSEGKFTPGKLYRYDPKSGFSGASPSVNPSTLMTLTKPAGDETVSSPGYRVQGKTKAEDVAVTVNGSLVRIDESGNFSSMVTLGQGPNEIKVVVVDASGAEGTVTRTVTYNP
ncbi:MAG: LysM peptidoglycan-binding domain-containing protein [Elusimicrobia bacterium]|nr:LysM peptidoglycan-binding domain-containing protein [Elusimicrobiota bacterium]